MTTLWGRRAGAVVSATGVSVVAAFAIGQFGEVRWPSVVAPMPATLAIPAFLTADRSIGWLVLALPAVLFLLWVIPTQRWSVAIPKRSIVSVRIVAVLSIAWFALGWRWAIHYQGWTYAVVTALLSLAALVTLEWLRTRQATAPDSRRWLVFHCLLFIWFFTYAFPWLGETP